MSRKIYFTPGPSALYPTFEQNLQTALDEQILSISHRSNRFRTIYQDTFEHLKTLFNLPAGFAILFTSSATETWENILLSCVQDKSYHIINGAFSKRFYDFAKTLGRDAFKEEKELGKGFKARELNINYKAELIAVAQNETSTGVWIPEAEVHQIKQNNPKRILALDITSSAPIPRLDFSRIDTAYFSVQKCFGMPAGLGVWLVHEKCLSKAELLASQGHQQGAFHNLTTMWEGFEKFQTQATPNILAIYILGKIAKDMLNKGIDKIRHASKQKAVRLYHFFNEHPDYDIFVQEPQFRSQTVIVANTKKSSLEITEQLESKNLMIGNGYGDMKDKQIRIANFPATSLEDVELLIEALRSI